jgi:hypothetical protein
MSTNGNETIGVLKNERRRIKFQKVYEKHIRLRSLLEEANVCSQEIS